MTLKPISLAAIALAAGLAIMPAYAETPLPIGPLVGDQNLSPFYARLSR